MRRRLRASAWAWCGWLLAQPHAAQAATQPEPATAGTAAASAAVQAAAPEDEMAFLDVRVNGEPKAAPRPLLRRAGHVYATAPDLAGWKLVIPGTPTLRRGGIDWYDLRALAGARLSVDEMTQTVELQVAPEAFEGSVGAARGLERPPVFPSVFGAFVNYDVVLQHDVNGTHLSGLFDGTASGDWGNLGTTVLSGQDGRGAQRTTRLDTYYSRDDPDRLQRLTLGDAITQAAPWSTAFRFGGVQFGTRFGLQPGYITYPLPTLRGGAAVPSSVEVYVDNVLRYQQPVNAGPFSIANVPVLSGAGEMQFAVTDALGVRRVVTTPYYVSANLLRAGLSDYSVEAGRTRQRYGERSFDYGSPFVSGSWRRGITDTFTVDVRAEAGSHSRTAGAGLTWIWGAIGEFSVHGAASSGQGESGSTSAVTGTPTPSVVTEGSGRLWRASYTRNSAQWNFSAVRQVASRGFTQIGWQDDFAHLATQTQVFAGRSFGRYGAVGASYTQLTYSTGDRVLVTSANWSIAVGERASLSTFIARTRQNAGAVSTTVGLALNMVLGPNRNASVTTQRTNSSARATQAEYSQQPLDDLGWGYRLRAAQGDGAQAEASADWRTRAAILSAGVARLNDQTAARLRATGSVGTAGGLLFATRNSAESMALVTVEGSPGVTVYRENQPWAVTDASGRAIVPGLRAYGSNFLSIDAGDLPIEATLRRDSMQVVPRNKAIADVRFDLSYDIVVNATVQLPDGSPLPPGLDVHGTGRTDPLISGFGGAVSVPAPRAGEVFEVRLRDQRCRFSLGPIDPKIKLPTLGPYTCAMMEGPSAGPSALSPPPSSPALPPRTPGTPP